MLKPTRTYLALGSNKGDKLGYLQQSLDLIAEKIGKIEAVSPIYSTPAWGFRGNVFLNACTLVKTRLSAEETLRKLLQIEEELGRFREKKNTYENRTIDLDIIFFGGEIIQSEKLVVPHPKMAQRKFVLAPLADIAPNLNHPLKNATVAELLEQSEDVSEIRIISEKLRIP